MSNDYLKGEPANPNPTHKLTLEVKEGFLIVHVTGLRTRPVVSSMVTEIAKAAIEYKRGKILIDVRDLEGWLDVFDSFSIVTMDFPRVRGKGILKVAIVDRPLPKLRDWFFETVSLNRGFNFKIFESPEIALDWLLGSYTAGENQDNSVRDDPQRKK